MIREIELQLSTHLLDKVFRDSVKENTSPENLGRISYECHGYNLTRFFTVKNDIMVVEDRIKTTSYRGTFEGVMI